MSAMKPLVALLVALLAIGAVDSTQGAITIDFEGVPTDYYFYAGRVNLGQYYAGLPNGPSFGPDAAILETLVHGYNDYDYHLPYSGNALLFSGDHSATIEVSFAQAISAANVYYCSGMGVNLAAYDGTTLVGSVHGDGDFVPGFLTIGTPGIDHITSIQFVGLPNNYVLDDFTYWPAGDAIPEPSALILWCGLGAAGLVIGLIRRNGAGCPSWGTLHSKRHSHRE